MSAPSSPASSTSETSVSQTNFVRPTVNNNPSTNNNPNPNPNSSSATSTSASTSATAVRDSSTSVSRQTNDNNRNPPTARIRTHGFEAINQGMPREENIQRSYRAITLQELESYEIVNRKTMIFGLLLKIKPSDKKNVNGKLMYTSSQQIYKPGNKYTNTKATTTSTPYLRMYHFYDIFGATGMTFYVLEYTSNSLGHNEHLWDTSHNLRDDGTLSPGCIICFRNPLITGKIGEIPVVVINEHATICKQPDRFQELPISRFSEGNHSRAFVLNGIHLRVTDIAARKTNCSGFMCDKQNWNLDHCGCIVCTNNKISNAALSYFITVSRNYNIDSKLFHVSFTSAKFSRLFFNNYFPTYAKRTNLVSKLDTIFDRVEDIVKHYNENGGFTVIGWFRQGEIQDDLDPNNTNDATKKKSSTINYHVVKIIPTNATIENTPALIDVNMLI